MPSEDSWERTARHVRQQAAACTDLGSPFYGALLERVAADLLDGGPTTEVLAGHQRDPGPSALALRLMGAVHRLVLEGAAPRLAASYPSAGGTGDAEAAWPALRETLTEHRDRIRAGLDQAPQTNEIGRAAALIGGLRHVVASRPGPVRLFEIGASGGLNLRADRFRLTFEGGSSGPSDSPVVLEGAWTGPVPPDVALDVIERAGCDLSPVDPTTAEGGLRLMSYVWPDQLARLERLRGALALAQQVPADVHREGAVAFVDDLRLSEGATTVLWHSVMWQYLPETEQAAVAARIRQLGKEATPTAGFAHLRMEPETRADQHAFYVVLRLWPGGEERVLGTAHPHGLPTHWW